MALSLITAGEDDSDLGFGLSDIRRAFGGGGRRRGRPRPMMPRRGLPSPLAVAPGGVRPQPGMYPVTVGPFAFSAATGLADIQHDINPQVNFKAQRMICTPIKTGATATVAQVLLKRGSVGIKPINLGGQPIPLEIFISTSVDMNIEYPQTRPGLTYDLTLGLSSALAGADTIVVYVTFLGTAYQ
jgi:hypothetical protein